MCLFSSPVQRAKLVDRCRHFEDSLKIAEHTGQETAVAIFVVVPGKFLGYALLVRRKLNLLAVFDRVYAYAHTHDSPSPFSTDWVAYEDVFLCLKRKHNITKAGDVAKKKSLHRITTLQNAFQCISPIFGAWSSKAWYWQKGEHIGDREEKGNTTRCTAMTGWFI